MTFHLFYGGTFSQWYKRNFKIDGVVYNTAEQWMMAEKARLFNDEDALKAILETRDPHRQKTIGRLVKNFDKSKWEAIEGNGKPYCWNVVYQGNYAKFSQNPDLKEYLLNTKGKILVEASPTDRIWGIGLAMDNPDAHDQSKWRGTNWLGEVLTQLRDFIDEETI
jgi:ribA/ribD-fused uncharacterized protein